MGLSNTPDLKPKILVRILYYYLVYFIQIIFVKSKNKQTFFVSFYLKNTVITSYVLVTAYHGCQQYPPLFCSSIVEQKAYQIKIFNLNYAIYYKPRKVLKV
ncbi:hypothetical protein BH23THE1_BH23THE1_19230 [soil metagenome]